MATIEEYFRDVQGLSSLPDYVAPQHSFYIYTNDSGEKFVLRGGQYNDGLGKNNLLETGKLKDGDLTVIMDKYEWDGIDRNNMPIDWNPGDQIIRTSTYYTGSDLIASQIWESMVSEGQNINNNPVSYKYLSRNCNTTHGSIGQAGEIKYQQILFDAATQGYSIPEGTFNGVNVPTNSDGESYWTPGLNNKLDVSLNQFYDFINGNKVIVYNGDKSIQLANSGLIATDATYVGIDGNPVSEYDSLFKIEDDQGNIFTIIYDNIYVPLKDGTIVALNTAVHAIDASLENTATFINSRAQQAYEIALTQITSNTLVESLIGSIIADLILGEDDPKEIAKHLAEGQLRNLATAILDDSFRDLLKESGMSETAIKDLLGQTPAGYITSGDGIIMAVDEAGNIIPTSSIQGTLYTAILNFAISAIDSGGWNSEEYAQSAKVAIASAIVSAMVTTALTAFFPGLGTAAGIVISAVINALVTGPLVNYVDNQYEVIENAFIIVRDITKDLLKDPINTLEDLSVEDYTAPH